MSLDLSQWVFSKYQIFVIFSIYYSRSLSSKLCIGMHNKVNCVKYYGTEGVLFNGYVFNWEISQLFNWGKTSMIH